MLLLHITTIPLANTVLSVLTAPEKKLLKAPSVPQMATFQHSTHQLLRTGHSQSEKIQFNCACYTQTGSLHVPGPTERRIHDGTELFTCFRHATVLRLLNWRVFRRRLPEKHIESDLPRVTQCIIVRWNVEQQRNPTFFVYHARYGKSCTSSTACC